MDLLNLYNQEISREDEFEMYTKHAGVEKLIEPIMPFLYQQKHAGLYTGGFFNAPASTKYHGVYDGGLFDHSKAVYYRLEDYTQKLGLIWERKESPFIIAWFHDLCKCDSYIKNNDGYAYNINLEDKRHAEKSLDIIQRYIKLTEEEYLCIRYHMGAYVKEDWSRFDSAIKQYETVLYTHTADMAASKLDET